MKSADRERIEQLRDESMSLHSEAWRRSDGGQELTLKAMAMEREADRLEDILAEMENGPNG